MYIICGCNGAGKTTASYTILSEMLQCRDFVNSDEIARGISPFAPSQAAIEAGRMMIKRINALTKAKTDFAFETTLAVRSYAKLIERTKGMGYTVMLVYFWLRGPEIALSRVQNRVTAGGHNIPENVVRRRYWAGLENLFTLYMPLCDRWLFINNSDTPSTLIAEGTRDKVGRIFNQEDYDKLRTEWQNHRPGPDE